MNSAGFPSFFRLSAFCGPPSVFCSSFLRISRASSTVFSPTFPCWLASCFTSSPPAVRPWISFCCLIRPLRSRRYSRMRALSLAMCFARFSLINSSKSARRSCLTSVWFSSARESWSLPSNSTRRSRRTAMSWSLLWATAFFSKAARRGSFAALNSAIRNSTSSRCLYRSATRCSSMASLSAVPGAASLAGRAAASGAAAGRDPPGARPTAMPTRSRSP